jgi:hypothetical protein
MNIYAQYLLKIWGVWGLVNTAKCPRHVSTAIRGSDLTQFFTVLYIKDLTHPTNLYSLYYHRYSLYSILHTACVVTERPSPDLFYYVQTNVLCWYPPPPFSPYNEVFIALFGSFHSVAKTRTNVSEFEQLRAPFATDWQVLRMNKRDINS